MTHALFSVDDLESFKIVEIRLSVNVAAICVLRGFLPI